MLRRSAVLAVSAVAMGCFSSPPPPPRYFEPVLPARSAASPAPSGLPSVRLRSVDGAEILSDRVVWRKFDVELGLYEEERWTESPARFVQRSLARELFEARGLRRGGRSALMVLDVEVRAFEELLEPQHQVRVELWVVMADRDEEGVFERSFVVVKPVGEERSESMARAMGEAMDEAVRAVGAAVQATLTAAPKPEQDGK